MHTSGVPSTGKAVRVHSDVSIDVSTSGSSSEKEKVLSAFIDFKEKRF